MTMYVLYESSSGYALFNVHGINVIGQNVEAVLSSVSDFTRFGQIVKLTAFHPPQTAQDALNQINAISEGYMSEELRSFLELNLPKVKEGEEPKFSLGVYDPKLGSCISECTKIPCQSNEFVQELLRGVRQHFDRFINDVKPGDLEKSQHGVARTYSRAKFNDNKEDHMVIQTISLLDTLDKDINLYAMSTREWYSWHFPELEKIVNDNYMYAQVTKIVEDKSKLSEAYVPMLTEVFGGDEDKAREVVKAGQASFGLDLSPIDLINVKTFAKGVIDLTDYRKQLYDYLVVKVNNVAPNLAALIGETVAARLISHAGSLRNLAMFPSSTLQIVGAEKALSRALRTKGKTPKHGLIFHSSFIGRATGRNKGRIARFLASKCSIAARVDYFGDSISKEFSEKLRGQLEERLDSLDNVDVMEELLEGIALIMSWLMPLKRKSKAADDSQRKKKTKVGR
ncbi:NOP56-like pre RNA processing ribonucleoprotein [Raphanus sativus]|nr:NOP56-like pre RNA processing ribonucleoprotein [Raphanus sativus]